MLDDRFDQLMKALDAPMVIVTAADDHERTGCLVGFHSQSSIEPRRCCVWISKANHTYRVMLRTDHFAVHFLATADRSLAELFGAETGDSIDKFSRCEATAEEHGVPILSACPRYLVLRRTSLLDEGGDHVGFVAEPIDARMPEPFRPLRLADVADLVAGHPPADIA